MGGGYPYRPDGHFPQRGKQERGGESPFRPRSESDTAGGG